MTAPLPPDLSYPEWLRLQARLERHERRARIAAAVLIGALLVAVGACLLWIWVTA